MAKTDTILTKLKGEIKKFEDLLSKKLNNYPKTLNELMEKIGVVEESWSGSWVGFHSSLYYGDFEKPPMGDVFDIEWGSINGFSDKWQDRSYENISTFIEKERAVSLEKISKQLQLIENNHAKPLQTLLTTELSSVVEQKEFEKERYVFRKIESIRFGISADEYVKSKTPGKIITRDSKAASQGLKIPPHIRYEAGIFVCMSMIADFNNLVELTKKLLRMVEIKTDVGGMPQSSKDAISKINLICSRFHSIVRQLRNRHNGRPTLDVEDEYDVQDLLHSLLILFFDDVRREEWTHSFIGSSARMDLILKEEKIALEVKKTRKRLRGKEIGEQLIIDVAKYQKHPECKTLVCFIYDPEGGIGNPTGLINDLMEMSSEKLKVIPIINPMDVKDK